VTTEGAAAVTVTALRPTTVRLELPDLPLKVAVIVALPLATPVTNPAETVASVMLVEVHVAWLVTSF
jgi:hypothetical protein